MRKILAVAVLAILAIPALASACTPAAALRGLTTGYGAGPRLAVVHPNGTVRLVGDPAPSPDIDVVDPGVGCPDAVAGYSYRSTSRAAFADPGVLLTLNRFGGGYTYHATGAGRFNLPVGTGAVTINNFNRPPVRVPFPHRVPGHFPRR